MLKPGDTVENFSLLDHTGAETTWASLRGRRCVFFFYPKASTPGCTKEACAFRDMAAEFEAAGAAVFGASADSVKRQSNFSTKNELNMPLLSDPDGVILKAWGVWGEKKMYGKTYEGIIRSTFVFDEEGKVLRVWSPVRVKGHVEEVLGYCQDL